MAKKNGFNRRKTGQIPAKADPVAQQLFLDTALTPVLDEAKAGRRHALFVDALWGALHKASNVERMIMVSHAVKVRGYRTDRH